jgi:hypothetical protein
MLPAALKIYNGNTANVMDCVSEQTMSCSKVLSCNAASRTAVNQKMKHTHSEMLHARYGTRYAFLFHRCLTIAEKVKKTSSSSQLTNTSYQECNHRNNTVTTNSKTTVQQPAEYMSWHVRHTLLASVSSTMKYTNCSFVCF